MKEKKATTKKTAVKKVTTSKKKPVKVVASKENVEVVIKKLKAESKKLEATVYSQKGVSAGTIALPEKIFGVKWNNELVHQVITGQLSNKRAGTAHTKDRSEVRGGGKKPWKQKGTGRARHGSSRSPIWVGGGTTHGPRSEKDYSKKINRKMASKALFTILSRKYSDGKVLFVDSLSISAPKTKDAAVILSTLTKVTGFERIASKKHTAVLIVVTVKDEVISKSFANLPGANVISVAELSALSTFNANHIVLVDPKKAVEILLAKKK